MRPVYCTGRRNEPHDFTPVHGVKTTKGTVFECELCKYDVRVEANIERRVMSSIAGDPIGLHTLAQVVTRVRARDPA